MNKKVKFFLVVAIILLLVMALVSSIDSSLVYLFFIASAFFFFLAYINRASESFESSKNRSDPFQAQARSASSVSVEEVLMKIKDLFASAGPRRLSGILWIFTVSIFSIIFLSVISNSENGYNEGAVTEYQIAEQFYWNNQYDSAYKHYKRALLLNPTYTESLNGVGNVMWASNQYDSALFYFDEALNINPEFLQAAYGKALVYYYQKKYEKVVREAEWILERDEYYNDAYLIAGDSYYTQNKFDSALYYYEPAYENGARSRVLCHIMAYIYDTQGNTGNAITLYKETLLYDSSLTDIYRRLGELVPGEEGKYYRLKAFK